MARYFTHRGQNQYTLKLLKQAIAINPNSTKAQYLYIQNLRLTKQLSLAYNHCRQVIKFKPDAVEILNEYAIILIQRGYSNLASQQLNKTLAIDPKNETTLFISGKLAEDSNNIEEALSYYRRSAQSDKQNIKVKLNLINFLLRLHKWDEAQEYMRICIGISPNSFDLLERQAWLLATCPDNRLRNGEYALELAKRLVLMRKIDHYQIIGSGMVLAAAYGELQQYEQAIQIASEYIDRARKINLNQYIPELEKMITFFRSGQPYRLQ
jgi:tetratricopeptide (TPR) repeat protein